MMARFKSFDFAVFAALAVVMLITRSHSLSEVVHLPETSLATFFIAGFYIRSRLAMPVLFALGFAIDLVVIKGMGESDFCFTPAYWMLLPAYGVMWLGGRFAARRFGASPTALPAIVAVLCGATLVSTAMHHVVHVQIADAPGRGEPGSGKIDWPGALARFERLGYKGTIGLELQPTKPSVEAFGYIRGLCA